MSYEITKESLELAYKPFDVVTNKNGDVGFIQEVNINVHQDGINQVSYAVKWLTGSNQKWAWYRRDELEVHCNLFVKIAQAACTPSLQSAEWVQPLFNSINR